jgi:TldD protein
VLIAQATANRLAQPPVVRPVDIGRYDIVCDAATVAGLVAKTLVQPTELDRAMGYEANVGGTSYLMHPAEMVGAYQIAAPLLTLTANRSQPGGYATVRWDDEGVVPDDFTLVKDGVLVDFQTTRESAAWLASAYQRLGKSVRSHGCAYTEFAEDIPMAHPPNIVLQPSEQSISFDDMVKETKRGIAVMGGSVKTDQQGKNGTVTGQPGYMREILNGKLGAILTGGGVLFNTTELWKNLIAIGGAASASDRLAGSSKGEPRQGAAYSIRAVPAKFTNLPVFDVLRKA